MGNKIIIDHGNGYQSVYRNGGVALVKNGEELGKGYILFSIGEDNQDLAYQIIKDDEYIVLCNYDNMAEITTLDCIITIFVIPSMSNPLLFKFCKRIELSLSVKIFSISNQKIYYHLLWQLLLLSV